MLYITYYGYEESIIVMLIMCVINLLMYRKITLSGIFLGLVMHLKLYPVIYIIPIFLWIGRNNR